MFNRTYHKRTLAALASCAPSFYRPPKRSDPRPAKRAKPTGPEQLLLKFEEIGDLIWGIRRTSSR